MDYQHLTHIIPPIWDEQCTVLILGTFPSVKSRACNFYYGHPQNRFWKVLAAVFSASVPQTVAEKQRFLLDHHIALWDVVSECEICGSADASIRHVVPNDIRKILDAAAIRQIFVNGTTAERLYNAYLLPAIGRRAIRLPSTSPANATWSLERLCEAWRAIIQEPSAE